jgi:hypothetical protein
VVVIMGILVKYRQVAEKIRDLEPDEASRNLVRNQELVLRRSSGSRRRSDAGRIMETEEKQYGSAHS